MEVEQIIPAVPSLKNKYADDNNNMIIDRRTSIVTTVECISIILCVQTIASSPSAYDFQSVGVRGARRIELLKEKGLSSTFYGRSKITNDIKSRRVYYASVWKKIPRTKDISVYSKLSTCSPSTVFSITIHQSQSTCVGPQLFGRGDPASFFFRRVYIF